MLLVCHYSFPVWFCEEPKCIYLKYQWSSATSISVIWWCIGRQLGMDRIGYFALHRPLIPIEEDRGCRRGAETLKPSQRGTTRSTTTLKEQQ